MPILDLQRRLREAGRIRLGDKAPKGNPRKLETFRFTSADEAAIEAIAQLYGGECKPWDGAPVGHQWEVVTTSTVVRVLVPPTELAFSQWLETWSGGGCVRRCDGHHDLISDGPCVCDPDDRTCKPTTRLGVILPELPGIGLWRVESHGWNAASEMEGTLRVIQLAQSSGRIVPARLLLEQREKRVPGKPVMRFGVPVLDLDLSVSTLTGGEPSVEQAPRPALTPIPALPERSLAEELHTVGTEERPARANGAEPLKRTGLAPRARGAMTATPDEPLPLPPDPDDDGPVERLISPAQLRLVSVLLAKLGIPDVSKRSYVAELIGIEPKSSKELTANEARRLIDALKEEAGE